MNCEGINGEIGSCNTFFILLGIFFVVIGLVMIFKFDWSKNIHESQFKFLGIDLKSSKKNYFFNKILSSIVGILCIFAGIFFIIIGLMKLM